MPAARSVPKGSVSRAAQRESRPKSVRYHGVPAAAKASVGESGSASTSSARSANACSTTRSSRRSVASNADAAPVHEVAAGVGVEVGARGTGHRDLDGPVRLGAGRDLGVPLQDAGALGGHRRVRAGQADPGLVAGVAPGERVAFGGHVEQTPGRVATLDHLQLGSVAGGLQAQPAAQRTVPARDDRDLLAQAAVDEPASAVHLDRRVGALVAEVAGHRQHPGGGAAAVGRDADRALVVGGQREAGEHPAVVDEQAGARRVEIARSVGHAREVAVGRDLQVVQPGLTTAVLRSGGQGGSPRRVQRGVGS